MEEQLLKTFARSVTGYFDTITNTPVQLGTPFLGEKDENLALDFSAIIGISGAFRGNVFYTAPRGKLPFRFGWQAFACPRRIRDCIFVSDVHDRVSASPIDTARRP